MSKPRGSSDPTRGKQQVRVILPPALLRLFPPCPAELTVPAATVHEAIDALDRCHPGMADRLRDSRPKLWQKAFASCFGRWHAHAAAAPAAAARRRHRCASHQCRKQERFHHPATGAASGAHRLPIDPGGMYDARL